MGIKVTQKDHKPHRWTAAKINEVSLVTNPAILSEDETEAGVGVPVVKIESGTEGVPEVVLKLSLVEGEDYFQVIRRLVQAAQLHLEVDPNFHDFARWYEPIQVTDETVTLADVYMDYYALNPPYVYQLSYTQESDGGFTIIGMQTMVMAPTSIEAVKAEWSTAYVNDLPDSAFLYIESGGEKDDEGKTTPRKLRHFPVKNKDGDYDKAHLTNAISRIPQSNASGLTEEKMEKLQNKARNLLKKHFGEGDDSEKAAGDAASTQKESGMKTMKIEFGEGAVLQIEPAANKVFKDGEGNPIVSFGEDPEKGPEVAKGWKLDGDTVRKDEKPTEPEASAQKEEQVEGEELTAKDLEILRTMAKFSGGSFKMTFDKNGKLVPVTGEPVGPNGNEQQVGKNEGDDLTQKIDALTQEIAALKQQKTGSAQTEAEREAATGNEGGEQKPAQKNESPIGGKAFGFFTQNMFDGKPAGGN